MTVIFLPPKDVHEMTGSEGHHDGKPETEDNVEERDVMPGSDVPKVHENNSQSIEGVENNDRDESYFSDPHEGRLVGANDSVVRLRANPDQRRVQNVDEEKKVDTHAGNSVQNPGPHAFAASIKRAAGDDTFLAGSGRAENHCG